MSGKQLFLRYFTNSLLITTGVMDINLFIIMGIAVPLVMAPLVLFSSKYLRYAFLLVVICALLFLAYLNSTGIELGSLVVGDAILAPVSFSEHPYSRIAVFGFTLVGSLALLFGMQFSKPSEQATALVALASVVGIVFSDNFIMLFIFWEMLTLSTAGLILLKKTPESLMAGLYFLSFHLAGGLIVLLGILLHYQAASSFALAIPEAGLNFFIIGFGFKAAFIPLHLWVARGYPSANFPSSVILAGLTTKIGVYAIARILPPHEAILLMGASMALVGVTCALLQHNMRRLLSYHIISQVGYMVAGVGLASSYAVDGALLHVVNHMLYKALLFMSVGAVYYATRTEDLHDLIHESDNEKEEKEKSFIWKAMPLVTLGAIVGALSISGIPYFNGFVSKYLLKKAMYGVGAAETMLMIASIGTAASFCKLIYFGFIKAKAKIVHKVPISAHLAIIATASFCVLFGAYPKLVATFLPYSTSVTNIYTIDSMWAAVRLGIAGLLLFLNLAAMLKKGIHLPKWLSIEYLIFNPLGKLLYNRFCQYGMALDSSVNNLYMKSGKSMYELCRYVTSMDKGIDTLFEKSGKAARSLVDKSRYLDQAIDDGYTRTGQAARSLADRSRRLDQAIDESFQRTGQAARSLADRSRRLDQAIDESYQKTGVAFRKAATGRKITTDPGREKISRFSFNPVEWSTKNLNFDTLLLALLLGAILGVIFYHGRW